MHKESYIMQNHVCVYINSHAINKLFSRYLNIVTYKYLIFVKYLLFANTIKIQNIIFGISQNIVTGNYYCLNHEKISITIH